MKNKIDVFELMTLAELVEIVRLENMISDADAAGCDGTAASLRSVRDRKIAAKRNEVRA